MRLFTSYFVNLKNITENIKPLIIAGFSPKWYGGERYESLASEKKYCGRPDRAKVPEKSIQNYSGPV